MDENRNIFVIYTAEDTAVMQRILQPLRPFVGDMNVTIWQDNPILPEQPWKPKNESRLNNTDLFLLLVSDAFMHSQFIQQLEFKMVIDRYKEGKSTVIPVIIDKCPWDIDFRADDYNFSLNELQVFPEDGKPIKDWDSSEQVYGAIASGVKSVITSLWGNDNPEEPQKEEEEKMETTKTEEQVAMDFDEEKEAAAKKRRKEELEVKRIAEQRRLKKENEAESRAAEARRLQEVESKQIAKEQRPKEVTESKTIEEKEKETTETKRKVKEKRGHKEVSQKVQAAKSNKTTEETRRENKGGLKKKLLIGSLITLFTIIALWKFSSGSGEESETLPSNEAVEESIFLDKIETDSVVKEELLSALAVGDLHDEGMVFAVDADSKNGMLVHLEDAGPMTWENAMKIDEQLGAGWRVPTFDELVILYKTVGQGATNKAEFSNGLYWSSTDFDQYQARLLRFRDGNRSYHYNKVAEHRKYRVRAIRTFSR